MSAKSNLGKCLKELENIRRKSLRNLAENCESEYTRKGASCEIALNYLSAKRWIQKAYDEGKHTGEINLSMLGEHNINHPIGYFLSHLCYHIK
jgi:hypothetical protein